MRSLSEKLVPISKLNGLDWTTEDLAKKFNSAYVVAQIGINGTPTLCYIGHFAGDAMTYTYSVKEPLSGGSVVKKKEIGCKINQFYIVDEKPWPCITNVARSGAVLMSYNPDRQWRRGFGGQNCFITYGCPFGVYADSMAWTFELAEAVVSPVHSTLQAAIAELRAPANQALGARAISNRYWLIRKPGDDTLNLYRRKAFVGSFLGKRFFINDDAKILKEELKMELPAVLTYA